MRISGSKSDVTFLLVLLALSLGFNVYLAQRAFFTEPRTVPGMMPPPLVPAGTKLPPLEVRALTGQEQTVEYSQAGPTVLYFFSPKCPWCQKNLANVRHLAAETHGSYRFIGVSLEKEGLDLYLMENALDFPVYCEPSEGSRSAYGLAGVPQTLVVSGEGELLENWSGAYGNQLKAELERFFEVELPGLTEDVAEGEA